MRGRLPRIGFFEYSMRMAEREGFEPSKPFRGLRDFESRAFGHSATSPQRSVAIRCVFIHLGFFSRFPFSSVDPDGHSSDGRRFIVRGGGCFIACEQFCKSRAYRIRDFLRGLPDELRRSRQEQSNTCKIVATEVFSAAEFEFEKVHGKVMYRYIITYPVRKSKRLQKPHPDFGVGGCR